MAAQAIVRTSAWPADLDERAAADVKGVPLAKRASEAMSRAVIRRLELAEQEITKVRHENGALQRKVEHLERAAQIRQGKLMRACFICGSEVQCRHREDM